MCGMVYLNTYGYFEDEEFFAVPIDCPEALEEAGIKLVDIEPEYTNDCWCCSDPLPSLTAANYEVKQDFYGDWFATFLEDISLKDTNVKEKESLNRIYEY